MTDKELEHSSNKVIDDMDIGQVEVVEEKETLVEGKKLIMRKKEKK